MREKSRFQCSWLFGACFPPPRHFPSAPVSPGPESPSGLPPASSSCHPSLPGTKCQPLAMASAPGRHLGASACLTCAALGVALALQGGGQLVEAEGELPLEGGVLAQRGEPSEGALPHQLLQGGMAARDGMSPPSLYLLLWGSGPLGRRGTARLGRGCDGGRGGGSCFRCKRGNKPGVSLVPLPQSPCCRLECPLQPANSPYLSSYPGGGVLQRGGRWGPGAQAVGRSPPGQSWCGWHRRRPSPHIPSRASACAPGMRQRRSPRHGSGAPPGPEGQSE